MDTRDAVIYVLTDALTDALANMQAMHKPQWKIMFCRADSGCPLIRVQVQLPAPRSRMLVRLEAGWRKPSEFHVREVNAQKTEILINSNVIFAITPEICYSHEYDLYIRHESGLRFRDAILSGFADV